MDTQPLPLVPFGKYKGRPITELLNDTNYVEYCKQHNILNKYPIIYSIVVNQQITTTNQNSKTPEHNKLQNIFLEKETQIKLLDTLSVPFIKVDFTKKFESLIMDQEFNHYFDSSTLTRIIGSEYSGTREKLNNQSGWFVPKLGRLLETSKIVFEDVYNWDFILYYKDRQYIQFEPKCDVNNLSYKLLDNIIAKHKFNTFCTQSIKNGKYNTTIPMIKGAAIVCCELKPMLGDDYPCVLRKMKTQIQLTEKHTFSGNFTYMEAYEYEKIYTLIIGKFESTITSQEQLITIFKQSNIKIIFIDELLQRQIPNEQVKKPKLTNEEIQNKIRNILQHNKLLQDQLVEANEKIKQLNEEVQLLKSQK
jgi:hypothetical protein